MSATHVADVADVADVDALGLAGHPAATARVGAVEVTAVAGEPRALAHQAARALADRGLFVIEMRSRDRVVALIVRESPLPTEGEEWAIVPLAGAAGDAPRLVVARGGVGTTVAYARDLVTHRSGDLLGTA